MNFDMLYKRTKTGSIQYWQISVQDVGSTMDERAVILKQSGQLGTTSPLLHREEIRIGKQKRTYLQQAEFQAQSDHKKKKDDGYKSLADLSIRAVDKVATGFGQEIGYHHPKYSVIGKAHTLDAALDEELPIFNTDASGNLKPMLAKAVDWKKVQYPCIVQPKLDGVRCLMVVDFADPDGIQIKFFSRSGREYTTLDHIVVDVLGCRNKIPMKFILDGEVYSDELTFQEITSAVKKQKESSLKLKLRVYDIVNDEIQIERLRTILELVPKLESEHITLVEHTTCNSHEEVKAYHDEYVSKGYEGAMIRHKTGEYGQGQRSSDLLKVKEFDESEFTFIRFETGQREEDLIAVCCITDGTCFKTKVIGTRDEKTKLKSIPEGKVEYKKYTVKHFGWTDAGLPRFPIGKSFRDYE